MRYINLRYLLTYLPIWSCWNYALGMILFLLARRRWVLWTLRGARHPKNVRQVLATLSMSWRLYVNNSSTLTSSATTRRSSVVTVPYYWLQSTCRSTTSDHVRACLCVCYSRPTGFSCFYALCFIMRSLCLFNPASQLPYINKLSWVGDVFSVDDKLYIVMELIEGATLAEHFASLKEKRQKFSESRIWNIFLQVCRHLLHPYVALYVMLRLVLWSLLRTVRVAELEPGQWNWPVTRPDPDGSDPWPGLTRFQLCCVVLRWDMTLMDRVNMKLDITTNSTSRIPLERLPYLSPCSVCWLVLCCRLFSHSATCTRTKLSYTEISHRIMSCSTKTTKLLSVSIAN